MRKIGAVSCIVIHNLLICHNSLLAAVLKASQEIKKSKCLRKLLQLILAFGNYMNSGHRGGAYGFEIDGINRTCDTKSSIDKNITFLHYIALIVEKKVSGMGFVLYFFMAECF